jgi:hypothetical protein
MRVIAGNFERCEGFAIAARDRRIVVLRGHTGIRAPRSASRNRPPVRREDWDDCRFVNLYTRSGEIVSCLIVGEESEVIGSRRAFWWALAKVTVRMTDVHASDLRMSVHALARVHAEARAMWDAVIERSSSIEELRKEPVYARSIHYDVISKMINAAESEAGKLGLEICRAMVLAAQSEDPALEAFAFERFKRFLWRSGEEPQEFWQ